MRSHRYNALQLTVSVARYQSLSEAAAQLHITKGALSHQIKHLERDLGFDIFIRHPRGIVLSDQGRELLSVAEQSFQQIDAAIENISKNTTQSLAIGVTTYFASRWLSPRLTGFMQTHPDIRLRIQPMIDMLNFAGEEVDLAIRWGNGRWNDRTIVPLMNCPAWPTGNKAAYSLVKKEGIESALAQLKLLHDSKDSNAWSEWLELAGLGIEKRTDTLIIPDPTLRVQAVLDGQGVALNDDLVKAELQSKQLYRLSPVELADYGYYLAYEPDALKNAAVKDFIEWITTEAAGLNT